MAERVEIGMSQQGPNRTGGAQKRPTTPRPEAKKASRGSSGEALLACALLVLTLFELVLITVCLVRAFASEKKPETNVPPAVTTPLPPSDVTVPGSPLFSGGAAPALPHTTGSSVTTGITVDSQYAILVDAASGEILAGKDMDTAFSPASLTKVMTLIVALEHLTEADLSQLVTLDQAVTDYATTGHYTGLTTALINKDKTGVNLNLGDQYALRDMLYGIGVHSAADCCVLVASYVCPAATPAESEAKFVALMNQKAAALGLSQTHFDNIVGYESAANVTTAREMTVIMQYASRSPLIRDILSTDEVYVFEGHYLKDGAPATYPLYLHNTLLCTCTDSSCRDVRIKTYERQTGNTFSIDGMSLVMGKTGYDGGRDYLVVTVQSDAGREYILVLGGAEKNGTLSASVGTMSSLKALCEKYIQ